MKTKLIKSFSCLLISSLGLTSLAGGWEAYMKDSRRSGINKDLLSAQKLQPLWQYKSNMPPQTAWSGPAKWDAYSGNAGLQSLRNFDPAFFVTGKDSQVFFGSSVTNAVHCLNRVTGKEQWVYFANGPVRFPPVVDGDRLYFAADDGNAYCLSASTGKLIWKTLLPPKQRMIASNGRLISQWPSRTAVLKDGDKLYMACSLVPWEPSYMVCINATDGAVVYRKQHADMTLEGAMLSTATSLVIPQGKAPARLFNKKDGASAGAIGGAGGTVCIITPDDELISGPTDKKAGGDVLRFSDAKGKRTMFTIAGTDRMLITSSRAWYQANGQLNCLDRRLFTASSAEKQKLLSERGGLNKSEKKEKTDAGQKRLKAIAARLTELEQSIRKSYLWKKEANKAFCYIKSGNTIISGEDGLVRLIDAANGKLLKTLKVEGRAYGLASWNGSLIVSTDLGHIYCYGIK